MTKKIFKGKVVKSSNEKTIIVNVERKFMDKKYKKYIKRNKNFAAHDENNACAVGDLVQIIETHYLPTPDTVGISTTSEKVRIDEGTVENDLLSPFDFY